MGKLVNLLIFMVVLQVGLVLLDGSTPSNTSIWYMATHPQYWNNLSFLTTIGGIALGIALTGIIIGTFTSIKTDFMVFATMITGVLSLGVPLVNLGNFIGKHSSNLFCNTAIDAAEASWAACPLAVAAVALTSGVLGIYFVFTVLDWWRGRD